MLRRCMISLNGQQPSFFKFVPRYYSSTVSVNADEAVVYPKQWNSAKTYAEMPGPTPLPIIGNVWRFGGGFEIAKLSGEMRKKYGDVVKMRKLLAFGDTIFLFDVRDIEWVFRNEGIWPRRVGMESWVHYRNVIRKDIFGDTIGLVSGQDQEWATFRTVANPILMQPRTTHQYIPPINEIADEFLVRVRKLKGLNTEGEMPEDFLNELNKWAFESITTIALDTRLGCLTDAPSERAQKSIHYMNETFRLLLKLDLMPFGKYHRKFNTPTWKKFVEAQDYFTSMVMDLIGKAEGRMKNNPEQYLKPEHEKSVFEKLIAKDKKIALVMTSDMLSAGIDTTAKVGGVTLYFLAKSPDTQNKLRAELKRLLPHKDSPITKTVLDEAKYLRACVKESLRIAPIAFGNIRITKKPMVIGGYQVPTGTTICINNLYLSTLSDEHYSNVSEYLPDRWVRDVKTENVNPFVSLPFGFGPRSCVGKRMANMEIEVLVAKMVRNFVIDWKHKEMSFKQDLLYGVADPLKFKLTEVSD